MAEHELAFRSAAADPRADGRSGSAGKPPVLTTPQPARHPSPTTKARTLAYVMFERPDLDLAERFLTDFGLRVVIRDADRLFLRGTGKAPYCYVVTRADRPRFVGLGFTVASPDDLRKLARLPGASQIETVDWPGGGQRVRLTDPSGFRVDAVCGQAAAEPLEHRAPLAFNTPDHTPRVDDTQRPPLAPPEVVKLGHTLLEVVDYQATSAWYTQHLGLIPSDIFVFPDGSPAANFFRLDLGDRPADHHTIAMVQHVTTQHGHSAFEVVDLDAVGMGQRVLANAGWTHAWGIGRHLLGSQVFDYWRDPWGAHHEHYCDGDMFTSEKPAGILPIDRKAMAQWGADMPKSFTKPDLGPKALAQVLHNLRHSPDLTFRKLIQLLKLT
ncbi:2,4,5-trihydroxytoluene oxygenase [Azospirillum sp. Sh1]|uniref:2,4,5-trihydroxytoluene oxygenase n=1 Tax=Azospirillum sp. Sh1 TaxID=2607285 RepID=UPI0011EF59D8|nr:2,4,5-trihydroxytoluene oxygenase [Azospirillum sp. Sh1]KAA0570965.1 glyoxalase [Azospirillum sp. Sh1]